MSPTDAADWLFQSNAVFEWLDMPEELSFQGSDTGDEVVTSFVSAMASDTMSGNTGKPNNEASLGCCGAFRKSGESSGEYISETDVPMP